MAIKPPSWGLGGTGSAQRLQIHRHGLAIGGAELLCVRDDLDHRPADTIGIGVIPLSSTSAKSSTFQSCNLPCVISGTPPCPVGL